MIPFDTISLAPDKGGGHPGEPDKTGTGKESCGGDVVTWAQGVIIGAFNRGAGEHAVAAERTDVVFKSIKQLPAQSTIAVGRAKE